MEAVPLTDKICVICRAPFIDDDKNYYRGEKCRVSRGLDTLLDYSEKYGDHKLTDYLTCNPLCVFVHSGCRKTYTNKHRYEQMAKNGMGLRTDDYNQAKCLQSSVSDFDWKSHCFFLW